MSVQLHPIYTSLLEVDWYKFLMANFLFQSRHRRAKARSRMICRTKGAALGAVVPVEAIREQFDEARQLRFTEEELAWLRESPHIPRGLFSDAYLDYLRAYRLPEIGVERFGDDLVIEPEGEWLEYMPWETVVLSTVNELNFRYTVDREGLSMDAVVEEGRRRLREKITVLRAHPEVRFAPFGLRRRAMSWWEEETTVRVLQALPQQILGVSNVYLAKKYGVPTAGTIAHEMFSGYAAIHGETDEGLRNSPYIFLREWLDLYGPRWTCPPTDTFGSESFFRDMPRDIGERLLTVKHDSGPPVELSHQYVEPYFAGIGRDPKQIVFNSTDQHTVDSMIAVAATLRDTTDPRFGLGTYLTNDLGVSPISLVMKVIAVNGRPAVKLSDNLNKAVGEPTEVERCKRVFGYASTNRDETIY